MDYSVALIPGFASSTKKPAWLEVIDTLTKKGTQTTPYYKNVIPLELYSPEGYFNPASRYNINTPIFNPKAPEEDSLALKILRDLEEALPETEGRLHIIAHSTGGLVIRSILKWLLKPDSHGHYYVKKHRITVIVFLATPHQGTIVANKLFARITNIGVNTLFTAFGLAKTLLTSKQDKQEVRPHDFKYGEIDQLRVKSEFLKELNKDGMLVPGIKFINAVGSGGRKLLGWFLYRYLFGRYLFGFIPTFLFPVVNDGLVCKNTALMTCSSRERKRILAKHPGMSDAQLFNVFFPKVSDDVSHSDILFWQSHASTKLYRDMILSLLYEDYMDQESG